MVVTRGLPAAPSAGVTNTAAQVFPALRRSAQHCVIWTPTTETAQDILDCTNLFRRNELMKMPAAA